MASGWSVAQLLNHLTYDGEIFWAGAVAAGDIVAWKLNGNGLLHVGIVSDRRLANGTPLVLHNIARGTREENLLFQHAIIGHYRMP